MLRIFTYQDRPVLAGLTWGPGRPAGFLRRAPLALIWADRTALLPVPGCPLAPEYRGQASLLSCLTGCLGEDERKGRVLCAWANDLAAPLSGLQASPREAVDDPAADAAQNLFFAAVVVNGKPAIGAERLFETREELVAHIEDECCSGQIDRLATTPCLAEELHSPIPVSLLSNPEPGFEPTATAAPIIVEGKPASKRPLWQLAAAGGIAVLALAAGALLLFPVQQSTATAPLPVAAVQITSRDEIAFGRNCLAAFAGEWPIAPGWQLVSEGCATPEMRDPALEGFAGLAGHAGLAPDHPVAYRVWHLRRGFDGAIARKAAEAVTATRTRTATGSEITMAIQGNRMFSSTEIAVPMRDLATDFNNGAALTPAALLAATEAVFLGLADSIVLQGGGNGGSTGGQTSGPRVRVTLKSGFAEVFERMRRIEGAEIARLNRSGGTVTLEITTRRIVTVPREIAAKKPATQTRAADQELTGPAVAPDAASSDPETAADMQEDETI